MADVTDAQRRILRHALGLASGRPSVEYRNHFVTGPGTDDYQDCQALVRLGLMAVRAGSELTGGSPCFFVTEAGRQVARDG